MGPDSKRYILAVEDSDIDFDIFETVFSAHSDARVLRCVSGEEAIGILAACVFNKENLPTIILMDLNLSGVSGIEILELIRRDPALKKIPVVVLSTSASPKDVERAYEAGANTFLTKPLKLPEFEQTIKRFVEYWFGSALLPDSKKSSPSIQSKSNSAV